MAATSLSPKWKRRRRRRIMMTIMTMKTMMTTAIMYMIGSWWREEVEEDIARVGWSLLGSRRTTRSSCINKVARNSERLKTKRKRARSYNSIQFIKHDE
jgi:hypothetical protein